MFTLTLIAAVGPMAVAQPSGGPPPAKVRVDAARMQEVEPRREVTGELRARKRSLVAAEEGGLVVSLLVEEGDAVAQGDVIAELDKRTAELEVARRRAAVRIEEGKLAERRVELARAERDLRRVRGLAEKNSATQSELEDAQSDVDAWKARVEQAAAELAAARADLDLLEDRVANLTIRAPFDGKIIAQAAEAGEWLTVGDEVVEMVAYDLIDAWIDVPQQYVERMLTDDRPIEVRIDALAETRSASVHRVVPAADPLSRMFPIVVRFQNADGRLKPGMSVVGLAPTGDRRTMLTVHKDGLLRDAAGAYVYFDAGGVAAVARVTPLFAVADRIVVRSGEMPPGASVVVEGNERLFPGQPLMIMDNAPGETMSRANRPEEEG
jgi:RND family efflux transporter MFP subunit